MTQIISPQRCRRFYINGRWVDPVHRNDYDVIDPATEEGVATISLGSAADVDAAVEAAAAAFTSWRATTVDQRLDLLAALRQAYLARSDEIAYAMTVEMGTPITFSREVQAPCGDGHIEAMMEALGDHRFERPSGRGGSTLRDEPVGVCGLITPWNWPVNQVIVKVAAALAAGCTMVLKPSEESPLSALILAEMIDDIGLPDGVFNLVNGDGVGVGSAIAGHPGIDLVSFTGSTRAGVAVTKAAADTVKRVSLELGGKSPNILFADADVEAATAYSVRSCFSNSGQSCDAPSRLLVDDNIYDTVVELAVDAAERTAVGDPKVDGEHLGPVVNSRQYDRIQGLIGAGIEEATLVAGGQGRPQGFERGYYVRPTVFAGVTNDMQIARVEVFGPVLSILRFADEDEAIEIANDTPYGLSAYIQTGDADRAQRVARHLRVGQVNINGGEADYDVPFGGMKQSGTGRENGAFGLEEYLDVKSITGT